MKIQSVALNSHDQNTYDGKLHLQMERYTRHKHNLYKESRYVFYRDYFKDCLDEADVFAFTYTKGALKMNDDPFVGRMLPFKKTINYHPTHIWDNLFENNIYYIDHHQSHAAYSFISSGYKESDILAIDGVGVGHRCCIFVDSEGNIKDLNLPIGQLWNYVTHTIGFTSTHDAGKVMGLAGYGRLNNDIYDIIDLVFESIQGGFTPTHQKMDAKAEDIAATLQAYTIDKIKEMVFPLKTSNNICLAGGVTYNGYLNEEFTRHYQNVFVPPAAGDEGQSLGAYMHADYVLNNNIHIPKTFGGNSYVYDGEYGGGSYSISDIAQAIAGGAIVGWYQGRSESGNRSLGNRSILADPRNPDIKDIINKKIKLREDFRPFAPSVLEDHYQDYFDTNQPSPHMSRIVKVKTNSIPGVTHVDNTARIQTVNRNFNKKLYDLINEFYRITGIPMLLNTSFNCREPIVETPSDAFNTFNKTQLDILVINDYMITRGEEDDDADI